MGATRSNQRWSMDFVSDRLADGRWFRILTVVDQYTRECVCAYADRSQTGEKVVEQMKRLVAFHTALAFSAWSWLASAQVATKPSSGFFSLIDPFSLHQPHP